MLSTCPSCLAQVNHADHLFDVTCECGTHFSPFLNVENSGGYDLPGETGASAATSGGTGGGGDLSNSNGSTYTESSTAFQEIVNFGENLGEDMNQPIQPMNVAPPATESSLNTRVPASPTGDTGTSTGSGSSSRIMVTGTVLSDYQVTEYFSPVSALSELDASRANPMQGAFDALWSLAQKQGATAILGLSMQITQDGSKVLLMGTPVRCAKLN